MQVLKPSTNVDEDTLVSLIHKVYPGLFKDRVTELFGVKPFKEDIDGCGNGSVFWRFYSVKQDGKIIYHIYQGDFQLGQLQEGALVPGN